MSTIKMYKDKLLYIKKDMLDLLDKVGDLKVQKISLLSSVILIHFRILGKGSSVTTTKER